MHERARERDGLGVALRGEFGNDRASGVAQAKSLRHLIERLAHCVVDGGAHGFVIAPIAHVHEHGMAAAYKRHHHRRLHAGLGNAVRIQMALQVVHGDERLIGAPRRALRERKAHNKRAHQARRIRHRHGIEVAPAHVLNAQRGRSRCQALVAHAANRLDMLAARDFGDHAAEARVEVDLAGNHVGMQAALPVDDARRGFVARALDRQDKRALRGIEFHRGRCRFARRARHGAHLEFHASNNGSRRLVMRRSARHGQRARHDDGVFAVGIIMGTHADNRQAELFIERLGAHIRLAHFKRHFGSAQIPRVGSNERDELGSNAAAAIRRVGSDFQNLHLAGDDPSAAIANEPLPIVGRPPRAVATRQFIGNKRRGPRIASHAFALHSGNAGSVGSVERAVRNARRGFGDFRNHGGTVLDCGRHDIGMLHARRQIARRERIGFFGSFFRQANALVFLSIGKARVHRQKHRGVARAQRHGSRARVRASGGGIRFAMPRGRRKIDIARNKASLSRKQQACARHRPQVLICDDAQRLENFAIFHQGVAENRQIIGSFKKLRLLVGDPFARNRRLYHSIGCKAGYSGIGKLEQRGIHFLAHGIGRNEHAAAHAFRPRAPRNGVERRDAIERHLERRSSAFGRGHANAHAREAAGAAPAHNRNDIAFGSVRFGKRCVDFVQKDGVARAMRGNFPTSNRLDARARNAPNTNGHDFIRRIKC